MSFESERIVSTHILMRPNIEKISASIREATDSAISEALQYLEMENTNSILKSQFRNRYATSLRRGEAGVLETYTKSVTGAAITNDLYELVSTGCGRNIIGALATLFTNPTQSWTYSNGESAVDSSKVEAQRESGGFGLALSSADWIACAVECSCVFVSWNGDNLKYTPISPASVHAKFHPYLEDNGKRRATDTSDIQDASVVVIDLGLTGSTDKSKQQYLAIFGRSDLYPLGRYVTYEARRWEDYPYNETDGDWRIDSGEIANPLTYACEQSNGELKCEYPIIILRGGLYHCNDNLLAVSTALYEMAIEIDMGVSRTLKDALDGTTGGKFISRDSSNSPLPETLVGNVALGSGQSINVIYGNNANAIAAMEVLERTTGIVANGYGVPSYMVVGSVSSQVQSGISLYIQTEPLLKNRDYRIAQNKNEVRKIFDIEQGLCLAFTGETLLPIGTVQTWNPGRAGIPETETEKQARLDVALNSGLISYVQYVMLFHNLPSEEKAKSYIEKIREQDAEYKKPGSEPLGILGRIQPRPPRTMETTK